ncbi:hypothetical protein PBY51_005754 [Eleginops maclovinus]|uniref:Ig-like domain-containing protein n=1 Tax=Eleginops maclovinus TaxID=56733 RepID=A0AAN7WTC4_ELEMC|nr:hypothetical protein PBY51_005754 [Eleginops maclovinus]
MLEKKFLEAESPSSGFCPEDWREFNGRCFLYVPKAMSWNKAELSRKEPSSPRGSAMFRPVLLVAAVLILSESSVHGSPEKVHGSAGVTVVLPCTFPPNDVFPTVEWSKKDLQWGIVFLYHDNCEDHEMKNPAYGFRTQLFMGLMKDGNASLRIADVQQADAGTYRCMKKWKNSDRIITEVELVVEAVPEPRITVMPLEGGGVTLECEATCWGPNPEITFLDKYGETLPADEPRKDFSRGCDSVHRRVTLQDAAGRSRVTCRVQQEETNETRATELLLPGTKRVKADVESESCVPPAVYTAVVTVLLCGCGALAVLLWKKYHTTAAGGSSGERAAHRTPEDLGLLERVSVENENMENAAIEKLKKEVCKLEEDNSNLTDRLKVFQLKTHKLDKTISTLRNFLNQPLRYPPEADSVPLIVGNLSEGNLPEGGEPQLNSYLRQRVPESSPRGRNA